MTKHIFSNIFFILCIACIICYVLLYFLYFNLFFLSIVFDNGKVFTDSIESPQQRFLNDRSKFQCVVGQVGCGKSAMASAKTLFHSYCYKNNLGFILMKSMRQMDVAAVRTFKEVCLRRHCLCKYLVTIIYDLT